MPLEKVGIRIHPRLEFQVSHLCNALSNRNRINPHLICSLSQAIIKRCLDRTVALDRAKFLPRRLFSEGRLCVGGLSFNNMLYSHTSGLAETLATLFLEGLASHSATPTLMSLCSSSGVGLTPGWTVAQTSMGRVMVTSPSHGCVKSVSHLEGTQKGRSHWRTCHRTRGKVGRGVKERTAHVSRKAGGEDSNTMT